MARAAVSRRVVKTRLIWATGTCYHYCDPDVAMQKAWENLLKKAENSDDDKPHCRLYVNLLFRNDVYNESNNTWIVTLTASINLA